MKQSQNVFLFPKLDNWLREVYRQTALTQSSYATWNHFHVIEEIMDL